MKRGFDWRGALAFAAIVALIAFIVWGMWATVAGGAELQKGELSLMARVVQAEATGEPPAGARAIAWTVMNRLREPETYGGTITKVLTRPYQYAKPAALNDTSVDFLRAMLATAQVLLGAVPDESLGSTHFARCDVRPRPPWMRTFERRAVIGDHCFFKRRGR